MITAMFLSVKSDHIGIKECACNITCMLNSYFFPQIDHICLTVQDRCVVTGGSCFHSTEKIISCAVRGVCVFVCVCARFGGPLHVSFYWICRRGFCSNKNSSFIFFGFLRTLYSCGNVIVLVIVHFINNWFMMILLAVCVYLKINAMKSLSSCRITIQAG